MTVVDDFLSTFFGPGNDALPGADFAHPHRGEYVASFVAPLRQGVRRPIILPRQHGNRRTDAYVITWDAAQATSVRAMIEAFVAHSIVAFDGRVARLQVEDPVDKAVVDLVGPETTFVLRPENREAQQALWRALGLLRDLLQARPERSQPIPRPPGRVLADFNAALAAGAAATSAELLDEMTALGGFSPINLAYLRVHRLARLGRDGELLRMPGLDDVINSRPPRVIADEILGAWARYEVLESDATVAPSSRSLDLSLLPNALRVGPLTSNVDLAEATGDALVGVAAMALLGRNTALCGALLAVDHLPASIRRAIRELVEPGSPTPAPSHGIPDAPVLAQEAEIDESAPSTAPKTWAEWGHLISQDDTAWTTTDAVWGEWPTPATEDAELAAALETVGESSAERAWSMVGPFIDADQFGRPAWRSARALLLLAATYDRWSPADLAGVQALLEVFTRGGPPAADYRDALDLIGGSANRWASIANAGPTLDMVDVLARSACSDPDARLHFGLQALEPLNRHRWRLEADQLWLAATISQELRLELDWSIPAVADESGEANYGAPTVLLYSLDSGALRRAAEGLTAIAPHARIHTSSNKVGSDQLRSYARAADVVALATRCAKHAATGFIRQHTRVDASICEADGAGSASLLRAAITALNEQHS